MGRIQSNVGLLSGVPITDTVNQLINLAAAPRTRLSNQNQKLQGQQLAVTELTAAVLSVQFATNKLSNVSVFTTRTLTSSNSAVLTAATDGNPPVGEFQFTPAQTAQKYQALSTGFADTDSPIGEGSLQLRFGGTVDEGLDLDLLNQGQGVARGKIKITDRSGDSATIDLRFALTVDDVLAKINDENDIDIKAEVVGDSIRLTDLSGGAENLRVQEVGSGSTAADLGLADVDTAADSVVGSDVLSLYDDIALDQLNDGSGLSIRRALPDLSVQLADGETVSIDFHRLGDDEVEERIETTLADLLETINEAAPGSLEAKISDDGDRIELTDLTVGASEFAVTSPLSGTVAEDLGLTGAAVGGVITSDRLLGGLKGPLLSSLGGGSGLGDLGDLHLQDRAGAEATVDLSSAESLNDVIEAINQSGVEITAKVNSAGTGLTLTDTSGDSGNLLVESIDGSDSAAKLGIEVDDAVNKIEGENLNLQVVSEETTLDSLNGGKGVRQGSFLITDADGETGAVNLAQLGVETLGDVITAVNGLSIGVKAQLNDAGDGLLLIDTLGTGGPITVAEVGSGNAAKDLHLLGEATEQEINGEPTFVIDGSTTVTIDISDTDTLTDLVEKLNDSGLDISASVFSDGSGVTPHRLSLSSNVGGRAGQLRIDASGVGFSFQTLTEGRDALLLFGEENGVLTSSATNTFSNVLDGVSLTVNGSSETAVTITSQTSNASVVSNVRLFVDQYNKLRDKIDGTTFFNEADLTAGSLLGSLETLRVDTEVTNLVTGRFFSAGSIQSVGELGITFGENGKLTLDESVLTAKFASDPDAVEEFFTKEDTGFAAKFNNLIDSLAGETNSLLVNKAQSLQIRIDNNADRIDFLTDRLDSQRELLLTKFFRMEEAIAKIQANLTSINSIQALAPVESTSG